MARDIYIAFTALATGSTMSNWFFSLQFRLIVGFAVVLALSLGSVSLYIGYAARQEVERIQPEIEDARAARVEDVVSRFFGARQDWSGVQVVVERAGSLYSRHIVVVDDRGRVVGDSRLRFGRPPKGIGPDRRSLPLRSKGRDIGSLLLAPSDVPEEIPEPPLSQFALAINRSLLWSGLVAGAGGLLLVSIVSRRALASVRALSTAARRLGTGDLTQRVHVAGRDEIGELGLTFNTMAKGLQDAERHRRDLVADVAHELRTPLSNIQGYVEAVRDGLLEPDVATLETIHQQVRQLANVVEDLRMLAEAEAPDFRLDLTPGNLEEVIRKSVKGIRRRSEAKGVGIHLEVTPGIPMVSFDESRIAQVMSNLLENATRHTPEGGEVKVNVSDEGESTVTVAVADSGEGIPPAEVPYVFERFHRVDPSRARATGGAGLGLTIAKKFVEAHGGNIRAESAPGEGSRFIFDIPGTKQPFSS